LNPTLRIMLVDDHAVVRMGFRLLLDTTSDLRVVAECGSGEEALKCYAEINPDVVVLDLSMGGMGGLEALSRLSAKWPGVRVLVLSAHEDTAHPRRALAAGALGFPRQRSAAEAIGRSPVASSSLSRRCPGIVVEQVGAQSPGNTVRPRIRGLRDACARQVGDRDRRGAVPQSAHGRHPSLQHQAETRRRQFGRTDADCHPQRADRRLTRFAVS
jgi:CheY-like chemotaxis protein